MSITPVRILLLLLVALSAALASLWVDQQGHWRNILWVAPPAMKPDLTPPASLLLGAGVAAGQSYASTLERPVFAPDRRPPPPPPPPAPPDPMANIQLHGIFGGASGGILARIDGKVRTVKVNEAVGPWTLKSVEGRMATFTQGETTREVELVYTRLGAVKPPTPAQAAAAQALGRPALPVANDPKAYYREQLRLRNELNAARGLPIQLE